MKCISAIPAVIVFGLAACDTMNRPITSGGFDPLGPPGGEIQSGSVPSVTYQAGQFVRAAMDNTAFFRERPKGSADADKLLGRGTSMKVISTSGSYLKVELDSGEIGFVPTVMIEDPDAMANPPPVNPGEFQVYPPINGGYGAPIPVIDPANLPPEGAIPTVIDPEAPSVIPPAPQPMPNPVEEGINPGPAPLPPNTEDLEAEKNAAEAIPKLEE